MTELNQGTAKNAPMTAKEASNYTGIGIATLKRLRQEGKKPKYSIFRGRPYYRTEDLDEFLRYSFEPKREQKSS